ncbi:family 31 glycoside hydrolase, partial [Thamnocephalis sphaerospora]
LGGVLDFYVYSGPTAADVVRQHAELVGKPHMAPLWALGWHQCRYGYENVDALAKVVAEYRTHQIPLEAMWADIDYMQGRKDFTFDPDKFPRERVAELVEDLHEHQQRFVAIIDPGIKIEPGYAAYDSGIKRDVFLRAANGRDYVVGKVWPGYVHFPDWFHPNTYDWWRMHLQQFISDVSADGIWIDMNEVANWCDGDCNVDLDKLSGKQVKIEQKKSDSSYTFSWLGRRASIAPVNKDEQREQDMLYRINNGARNLPIETGSAPIDAIHANGLREYDVHNLYGHMESILTRRALQEIRPQSRPFILTRSTFAGTGAHAAHWTGDNWSQWDHLADSITGVLNFQLFGIPFVGADICGFVGNATEELCIRWHQLGAFYPFARNHNAIGQRDQEPYVWPAVASALRTVLDIRYALLSYLYTLSYNAHVRGDTLWRPLFFEFPVDEHAHQFDQQVMIGGSFMLTPVVNEGQRMLDVYFPHAVWFDWYTSMPILTHSSSQVGDILAVHAPLDRIPLYIRGGRAIALHRPGMTTLETHNTPFTLLLALDTKGRAQGELYLDDGISQH